MRRIGTLFCLRRYCTTAVARIAQLLVVSLRARARSIAGDFDHVVVRTHGNLGHLVDIGLGSRIEVSNAGRELDAGFGNGLVVAKVGDALVHHLDGIGVHHANSSGSDFAGDIGGALCNVSRSLCGLGLLHTGVGGGLGLGSGGPSAPLPKSDVDREFLGTNFRLSIHELDDEFFPARCFCYVRTD